MSIFMVVKHIEVKYPGWVMFYKFVDEFESDEEICKYTSSGLVSYFISNKKTLVHDNFTLNVIQKNIPVITDIKRNVIVAKGYSDINLFLQNNNLGVVMDILELENC